MKKEVTDKMRQALAGKTVEDIITSDGFRDNLAAYIRAQREDREAIRKSYEAMRKMGGAKGYKLPAHAIDDVADFSVEELAGSYALILAKKCPLPARTREYIRQLGQQAYNKTVIDLSVAAFPELRDELIPKAN